QAYGTIQSVGGGGMTESGRCWETRYATASPNVRKPASANRSGRVRTSSSAAVTGPATTNTSPNTAAATHATLVRPATMPTSGSTPAASTATSATFQREPTY